MMLKPIIQTIAERVVSEIHGEELSIDDYCVCLRAAYVVIKDQFSRKALGMAHIPHEELHGVGIVKAPSIDRLVDMVIDLNTLNRVLGLATVNAISQYLMMYRGFDKELNFNKGILDLITEGPVCVIGRLDPLVRELRKRGIECYVFEKSQLMRGDAYSEVEEFLLVPRCRVNVITGMTLLNFTLDTLLRMSRGFNIVTGPSVSVLPKALGGVGMHAVASILFTDVDRVISHLRLGNYVSLVTHSYLGKPYIAMIE
jgi:uncharacterized protein (DUF4213/DUF364 family)